MLTRLAYLTMRHRRLVIAAWAVLAVMGVFAAGQMSTRWFQSFSIPGKPAYQASERALHAFGAGTRPPDVVVFRTPGDVTRSQPVEQAMRRAAAAMPGALVSSYFTTHDLGYVSKDRHTGFLEIYPPGPTTFQSASGAAAIRTAAMRGLPPTITVEVTGHDALEEASSHGSSGGTGVLIEALIGGLGALVILLFVFGTLPAVLVPLAVAAAAILNTFTCVWALSYVTHVSLVVQYLIALVGLGVAVDYGLLMICRFRDELATGSDVETAVRETVRRAGHSVIVSGSTVAVGLLAMVLLPVPFIRSIGLAGMLIPAVSVLAAVTLLPALLGLIGHRIDSLRLLPRRFVSHSERENNGWARWARLVTRRPRTAAVAGVLVIGAFVGFGTQLNASEPELSHIPATGSASIGRQMLADAGIAAGVMKPLDVLVERGDAPAVAARLRAVPGIVSATAPSDWARGSTAMVEAFPAVDGSSLRIDGILHDAAVSLRGTGATVTGATAVDREFRHTLYANFPGLLAFVFAATLLLLTRAFRSVVLAVKAVTLNAISLLASFGIVVLVFQQGHGAQLWHIPATGSVTPWMPLMTFAFLYGLSMDYEVFMLARIRESYDDTGSTDDAIVQGVSRTGKLVTSAALILVFAFLVLATSPGYESKEFGIGIAGAILIDATVIRALLVPAIMKLLGRLNWWSPTLPRLAFNRDRRIVRPETEA